MDSGCTLFLKSGFIAGVSERFARLLLMTDRLGAAAEFAVDGSCFSAASASVEGS